MYEVTSNSHYMRDKFPNWDPIVVGTHPTLEQAERHITRIKAANGGFLPSNRDIEIREKK